MTLIRNFLRKIRPILLFLLAFLFLYYANKAFWTYLITHSTPSDVVAEFGNGKYELGRVGNLFSLEDRRFKDGEYRSLISIIEKYSVVGNQIYMVGDYTDSYCRRLGEHSPRPCEHMDFATGEYIDYKPGEPVPRYLVLDFENDRLRMYVKLEEAPTEDQAVFEKTKVVEGAAEARQKTLDKRFP